MPRSRGPAKYKECGDDKIRNPLSHRCIAVNKMNVRRLALFAHKYELAFKRAMEEAKGAYDKDTMKMLVERWRAMNPLPANECKREGNVRNPLTSRCIYPRGRAARKILDGAGEYDRKLRDKYGLSDEETAEYARGFRSLLSRP